MQLSVIITCYNQRRSIQVILEALCLQNFDMDKFEVIVVDDGSSPPAMSGEIRDYPYNFKYEFIPRTPESCRSKTRNRGASLAQGEFLVFIDGDTLPNKNFLKIYSRYFSVKPKRTIALGTRSIIPLRKSVNILNIFSKELYIDDIFCQDITPDGRLEIQEGLGRPISDYVGCWTFFISCNFCIKKEIFFKLKGFDEQFKGWGGEDIELGYRLAKNNLKYEIIDNTTLHLTYSTPNFHPVNHYLSWITNIKRFFSLHQDECILLLLTHEQLIYDSYHLGKPWNTKKSNEIAHEFLARCEEIHSWKSLPNVMTHL